MQIRELERCFNSNQMEVDVTDSQVASADKLIVRGSGADHFMTVAAH